MACNCVTNEQLNEIYRQFGTRIKTTGNEKLLFRVKNFFVNTFALTTLITTTPLVLLYVSKNYARGNNQISLNEFFGLRGKTNVLDNVG